MNASSQGLYRRYRVFISSTFDLEEHRLQAVLGIVSAGHMAVPLENYPPEGDTKQTVIFREIESCQFYVIILGSRYGTIPADRRGRDEKSYVELELNYALLKGLKILAFVIDQTLLATTEPIPDGKYKVDNPEKYFAFRDRLTGGTDTVFHRPHIHRHSGVSCAAGFWHHISMATRSKPKRLWDGYAFPGFRPQPRCVFGDAKARVITHILRHLGEAGQGPQARAREAQGQDLVAAVALNLALRWATLCHSI